MSVADLLNGLDEVFRGSNPGTPVVGSPMPRWQRILATTIPETAGAIAAAPTALYGLADAGLKWASGGRASLPGAEGANEITQAIHKPVREFSNRLAGEPIQDNLVSGDDAAQLVGAWSRLGLGSVISLPAGAAMKVAQGAEKLRTGVKYIDASGEAALKTLEFLSPVLTRPATPAIAGISVALPATIGTGLELAFPQQKEQLDAEASRATDVAVSGVQEAADGKKAIEQVQPVQAGFSTGDAWTDAGLLGIASAASIAYLKRDVLKRVTAGMMKGDESTQLGPMQAFRSNIVDDMAPVKDTYSRVLEELQHPNRTNLSQRFESKIDAGHGAAIDTKLQSLHEFGEFPGSKVKFVPLKDTFARIGQLDPARIKTLEDGLLAEYELGIRTRLAEEGGYLRLTIPGHYGTPRSNAEYLAATARGLDETKTAYHYADANGVQVSAADLNARMRALANDPDLMAIKRDMEVNGQRILDYTVEQRYHTPAERANLLREKPHFFPHKLAPGNSHLGMLDPKPGGGLPQPGSPLDEYARYFEQVVRRVEANKNNATFIQALLNAKAAGNPTATAILGRQNKGGGAHSGDRFVYYRDRNGVPKDIEINDPLVRRALQNSDNISRLHALSGVWAMFSRLFQSSATGAIATAIGQPFAHTAALYAATAGTVMRPKGIAAGPIDAFVQSLSGGKIGVRGDLSNLAVAAPLALRGMSAVLAQRGSRLLRDSVLTGGPLARSMSPAAAQALSTALANHYKRSWVHAFKEQGLLGPAVMEGLTPSTARELQRRAVGVMRAAQVSGSVIRETHSFINDMLHAVSSSPTAAVMVLNRGKNPELVARAIRDFTGDPGKSGAFQGGMGQAVGKLTAATPWGNIFIQSTDKLIRSLGNRKTAIPTLVGMTNAVGLPVISAALWNQSLGPEYVDYQYNKRNPDRQAASIYVALPGLRPEQGLEIPVDPVMRPYKYAVELLAGLNLGLFDGSLFKPGNEGMRQSFKEMVRNRWTEFDEGSVGRSMMQQTLIPPVPPPAGAAAALLGVNLRGYTEVSPLRPNTVAGFTGSDARDPMRGNAIGVHESASAESVIRQLGANAAYMAYNMFMDASKRVGEGQSANQVLKNAKQQVSLGAQDSAKAFSGALFGTFASVSPSQESSAIAVKEKVEKLRQLDAAYKAITSGNAPDAGAWAGTRGRGFQMLQGGAISVNPSDPMMAQFSQQAHQMMTMVDRMIGQNKDLYQQRQSIQISTKYSPEMKRALMNEMSNGIIENNRAMLQFLQQTEYAMSRQFGVPIRFDKIQIEKPISQFSTIP